MNISDSGDHFLCGAGLVPLYCGPELAIVKSKNSEVQKFVSLMSYHVFYGLSFV